MLEFIRLLRHKRKRSSAQRNDRGGLVSVIGMRIHETGWVFRSSSRNGRISFGKD